MNKIYKLKYDRRRNQLVAVSELTTGAGKDTTGNVPGLAALNDVSTFRKLMGTLTPLAFMTGLVISMLPGMALAAPDLPAGGQIVAGQGSISSGGNQMTIHQGSHGLVTNWNSFDIGKNHTVQFVQPDSSAVALNRVTGGHESQILGTLTANGQVMLVNPAGVMFGKGAKVNTAGMLASTKNISTDDFMAGRYTFSGGSHPGAEIINQGSLTTTKGGYIVLVADRVRNSGTIRTPSGKTVLAAADKVTLQLDNTGLASVSVSGSVVNALVENSGLLSADDGHVYLTARGKDMLLNTVVNNRGTVEAKGLSERGGEIVLDGGDSGVVSQAGLLLADSEVGRGGKVTVQGQNIHLAAGSKISATGKTGGGEVYVGGGWQGQDSAIRHASKVVMDKRAVIDVSARERGQGGTAVLWSDDYTNFRGTILARGGLQGGDGGRVETSSHHNLQAFGDVDASAVYGNAGEWLLDPFDISIVSGSTDTNVDESANSGGVFTPHASSSQVSNGTINTRLNSGTNVTIKTQTAQPGGSNQWGNITVNADINHTASNNVSLTLEADGNINITNHNITSSGGKLDVNLYAAGSHDGSITLNKGNISSNGGNITLGKKPLAEGATATTHNLSMNITNSTLNATGTAIATAGNISLTANKGTVLNNATLKGGNITVNATSASSDAVVINNSSNLEASGNLAVTGCATGSGYGIHTWGSSSFTAGDKLTLTGKGKGSDGAFNASGITLNATEAVIEGNASGANGKGIVINGGNLTNTRTNGNLTLTGVSTASGGTGVLLNSTTINTTGNLTVTGNSTSGLGLNISAGNLSGANVALTGTTTSGSKGMQVNNASTLNATTGNLSLVGTKSNAGNGYGIHIYGGNNLSATGNITLNASAMDGNDGALNVDTNTFNAQNTILTGTTQRNNIGAKLGGTINATQGNLSVTGVSSTGGGTGLLLNSANISAQGNITASGQGYDSAGGGLNVTGNSNFSAKNTVLSGSAGRNNNGTVLSGNINVTQGNLSVSGTVTQSNGKGWTGLLGKSGLNITVSNGNLSLSGCITGVGASGASTALNLTGVTLSANHATFNGSNNGQGSGFVLNNTTLNGGIAQGTNTTYSSCGSVAAVTNTLNINGGLGYGAFLAIKATGFDNNTTIGALTAGQSDLEKYFNFNATKDWVFDASSLNLTPSGDKAGVMTVGGFTNITACTTGNISLTGLNLNNSNLTGADISLKGSENGSLTVTGTTLNATTGNVSLSANVATGNALMVSGGNITAKNDITLNGTAASGSGYGLSLNNVNMTATGNITGQGTGFDASGGALQLNGGTFSAQNTVLSGTAGRNNKGAVLSGNINVTAGNLSLTGTTVHQNNGGYAGLTVKDKSSLNINVSSGNLSLTGQAVKAEGAADDLVLTGNTVGLNLVNTTLSANNLTLKGSSAYTGSGFILNNLSLSGNIAQGNNTTFSSAGSAADATNTLNINGGLRLGVFEALKKTGIENNTSVGCITAGMEDMKQYMNFTGESADWTFDGAQLTNATPVEGKAGAWSVGALTNITACTTGNISLTGVSLTHSNLTGADISLKGSENGSLTVTGTTLNATTGNVNLSTTNGTLTVGNVNITSKGGNTLLCGTSLADNSTGVKLNGKVNITSGNLTVTGTGNQKGIDAVNTNLSVSGGNLTLNGTVSNVNSSVSSVGIDLSGNQTVINASTANLTGVNTGEGYGFLLNASLQGGLTSNGNLTLSSKGSGANVSNQIGSRVNSTVVKHMVENNQSIGSRTDVAERNIYNQQNFTSWMSNGNLTKSFGDFVLGFDNINISAGSINLTGASFSNSNLTATSGDLTINNGPGSLGLSNTTLNASAGNITLTGGKTSLTNGANVTAKNDITVTGSKGGVNITGTNITSTAGNISVSGNGTGFAATDGVFLQNAALNASAGNISVTGTGDQNYLYLGSAGLRFWGNVYLTSLNNFLSGNNTQKGSLNEYQGGVKFREGTYNFTGNTSINAHSDSGAGILFMGNQADVTLNFTNGTVSINATSDAEGVAWNGNSGGIATINFGDPTKQIFNLNNATLNINASAKTNYGFDDRWNNGYVFQGNGSLNINASSVSGTGVSLKGLDSSKLNGTISLTGSSQSGTGVSLSGGRDFNLSNVTVTGSSQSGTGVYVGGKNNEFGNSTITGSSDSGSGVVLGSNTNISNTTVAGSSGSSSGVSVSGNNVNISNGSTLNGTSVSGDGVSAGGTLNITNGTVNGNTTTGSGVNVSGNLTMTDTTLTGNASGNGSGIYVGGNLSGSNITAEGNAQSGTGVTVGGDSTLTNVTLSGTTGSGTGVNVSGNLTTSGSTTVTGNASGSGTGGTVSGNLNGNLNGSSTAGTGVVVNGTVNGTVNGSSSSGTGAVVGDGAEITTGSQVNGQSGSGTGSVIEGNVVNNGTITGSTDGTGDGVSLNGTVTGGTVTGNASAGTGVNVSGDSTLNNVTLNGKTESGTGVDINGNLTSTGTTTVTGNNTGSGSGLELSGNVSGGQLNGGSVSGPGVIINEDIVLDGTVLGGTSASGSGIQIEGNVTSTGGSALTGNSGSGAGVSLNGTVNGGSLTGNSGSGAGLHVTGNSSLNGVDVTASSESGEDLKLDGVLSTEGGSSLNGVVKGSSTEERRQVYELQNRLPHSGLLRQAFRASGWQPQDKPVSVEICTDGECRSLDAGTQAHPSR
ncbi:hypothetical protein LQI46_005055 [Salmonella enterica]|nr:hypothetical protein [Salmonella enterica]